MQDKGTTHASVVIVGAGFSGMGMAVGLLEAGRRDFVIFERAASVGGTWRDNSYPNCRCDVPSHLYSFSFAPNPDWPETYSPAGEIHAYQRRVAEEKGLLPFIRFDHEVLGADWDDDARLWRVETNHGNWTADVVVGAFGLLAEPVTPDIPGIESFAGEIMHSARWNHDHDLRGERVAVIGTGASAIQFVPGIQPTVGHMTVFQRTAPWVLPHRNRRISRIERALYRRFPTLQRLVRNGVYYSRELVAAGMIRNKGVTEGAKKQGLRHIEKSISDPALRAKVTPEFEPFCKRILLSDDYYTALDSPNVDLNVDGIAEIRPHSVVTQAGDEIEVDTIVLGTGFHVTDSPMMERFRNGDGHSITEICAKSRLGAYNGTVIPTFPNLFIIPGPNTGIGHTSLIVMIEAQVGWTIALLEEMDRRNLSSVAVKQSVHDGWCDLMDAKTEPTVWNSGCSSWYLDKDGRNSTLWPGLTTEFRKRLRTVDLTKFHTT
ncbi:flavin-containing monooxygenase [Actinospongicola halichondriae]|uniref:flavin-containing monooxygenase n=1 Tax=Actinospongicola halichondriae TaxID=3236844 RepID=UPI003D5493D5